MNKRRKHDAIENPPLSGPSGHEVGTEGERFIEQLWKLPFGRDFLFANPKYKKGQNEREVCDLLLLLDNYVVVVQIKTAEPASKSEWDEQRWADWHNKKIDESLKQLRGGLRAMLDGRVLSVENDRQGRVEIDPKKLTHLFGIVIVDGPTLDHWGAHPVVEVAGRSVPVLLTSHQHMIEIVTELSTPMDLIDYLGAHARFFEHNELLGANELDLLAFYKHDPDKFLAALNEHTTIIIDSGYWESFAQHEARQKRSVWDQPSYIIDALIKKLHEARFAELEEMKQWNQERGSKSSQKDGAERSIVSLARMRRVDRRLAGRKIIEKSQKCLEQRRNRHFATMSPDPYGDFQVFLISTEDRKSRVQWLEILCVAGLLVHERSRVIGYATEPVMGDLGFSIDTVLITDTPDNIRKRYPPDMLREMYNQFQTGVLSPETEFGGPQAPPTTTPLDPDNPPATVS